MKKIAATAIVLVMTCAVYAQGTLPASVSSAFEQKFPKAKKVKWTPENIDDFQAEFALDSVTATALFTPEGKWIQTGIDVPPAILIQPIHVAIKKKYPKAKINKALKVEHSKKQPHYEIELKMGDGLEYVYYDLNGQEITSFK